VNCVWASSFRGTQLWVRAAGEGKGGGTYTVSVRCRGCYWHFNMCALPPFRKRKRSGSSLDNAVCSTRPPASYQPPPPRAQLRRHSASQPQPPPRAQPRRPSASQPPPRVQPQRPSATPPPPRVQPRRHSETPASAIPATPAAVYAIPATPAAVQHPTAQDYIHHQAQSY
jgi:hypothetical protein